MAYVIPTIFTAVNGMNPAMVQMGNQLRVLALKARTAQEGMNGALPGIGAGIGRAMGTAATFASATAIIAALVLSGKAVLDYQTEIQDLSAVTGTTGTQLDVFRGKIEQVAEATKTSMVEVAKAFTAVDNNMPELHTDATGLAEVTKQSVILAQAARMELGPAAEAMTTILNQFRLSADMAHKVGDAMAGGAVVGSSRVGQTVEALQKFAAASKDITGVTYQEAIAFVELGSKIEKGAEGGTRLRNILLKMAALKIDHPELKALGVNMETITSATAPLKARLTELAKLKAVPGAFISIFGTRNAVMAAGAVDRLDEFDKLLAGTEKEGLMAEMAEKNTDSLTVSAHRLVAAWDNMIITSPKVNGALALVNGTTKFLTNHLDGLVSIVVTAAEIFAVWKGYMWSVQAALFVITKTTVAYSYVTATATVVTGRYTSAMFASAAGMRGLAAAAWIARVGILGLVSVVGVAWVALSALTALFFRHTITLDELNATNDKTADGFVKVDKAITDAQVSLAAYNSAMVDYNQNQVDLKKVEAIHKFHVRQGTAGSWSEMFDELPYWKIMDNKKEPKKIDYYDNPADTARGSKSEGNLSAYVGKGNPGGNTMDTTEKLLAEIRDGLARRPYKGAIQTRRSGTA